MDRDLQDLLRKCRFCFTYLESPFKSLQISSEIKQKFYAAIHIELKSSRHYSNHICDVCYYKLEDFTDFQTKLFNNQTRLYQTFERSYDDGNHFRPDTSFESVDLIGIEDSPGIKAEVLIKTEVDISDEETAVEASRHELYQRYGDEPPSKVLRSAPAGYKICPVCSKILKEQSLYSHMKIHNTQGPFSCDSCNYQNSEKKNLASHMTVHMSQVSKILKCQFCSEVFSRNSSLRRHKRKFHEIDENSFTCECGIGFSSQTSLQLHKKQTHGSSEFSCTVCEQKFSSRYKLNGHCDLAHNPKRTCEICGELLAPGKTFSTHMKVSHGVSVKRPSAGPKMQAEEASQDQEVPPGYKLCPFCAKILRITTISMHIKAHLNQIHNFSFTCDLCGYENYEKKNLVSHMVVHQKKDKAYTCKYCPEKFTRSSAKRRHERRLHEEPDREYRCECGKIFGSQASLYAHRKETHGQGSFICPRCNSEFTTKSKLQRHIMRQHEAPKVQCQVPGCNHASTRRSYLAIHINSHRDIDPRFRDELLLQLKSIKMAT